MTKDAVRDHTDPDRCPSMHWHDPSECIKPKWHDGDHADAFGLTWTDADDASPTHVARRLLE